MKKLSAILTVLCLVLCIFSVSAECSVQDASASAEDCSVFDPDEVQYAYNDIIDSILEEMSRSCRTEDNLKFCIAESHGSISDFFGYGVNQMLLTYTEDGSMLKAGIYVTGRDYKMVSCTIDVAALAGGATCEVIPGSYDSTDAVFVLYENWDGDMPVGELTGYDITGDEITCVYSQSYKGNDELKKISEDGKVYLGATACSFGCNGTGSVINTLQAD